MSFGKGHLQWQLKDLLNLLCCAGLDMAGDDHGSACAWGACGAGW